MNDKNPQESLYERLFKSAREKENNDEFTIGDFLVLTMGACLLLFTIYFSWDFLNRAMPSEYKILAIAGLWGLDIGIIFWSLVYIFGSTAKWQDFTALSMLVIDYVGVALTTIIGFLTGRHLAVPELIQVLTLYGVIGIILINVLATGVYHLASPQTAHKRKRRKALADLIDEHQRAEIELACLRARLRMSEAMINQRRQIVEKEQELAAQALELEEIEEKTRRRLNRMPPSPPPSLPPPHRPPTAPSAAPVASQSGNGPLPNPTPPRPT